MENKRKMLVTAALPYANGDIHFGHLVEYLQADIWVRFQKMRGNECVYICADDTHGTPIMISARSRGIAPEQLIAEQHQAHLRDFIDFEIAFDNYYTTNSPENRNLSTEFFRAMEKGGHIEVRTVKQLYCPQDRMFLPDRFVTGTCHHCGATSQYGDSCDHCSATYSPTDLHDARCVLCGSTPMEKESEHFFFQLDHFREFLCDWVPQHTAPEVANKLQEWLKDKLRDWDITRDAPYFGFEIPGHPGKYFYVWVDAPIGYISSTQNWCQRNHRDAAEFWREGKTELYHFIGKDIVYFHTLFWPAMLKTAGYKTPDQVFVHGFLRVNGEKMSKSKGTFIKARSYLNHLEPQYLRYYYACKMTSTLDDIDFSFDDFLHRVNAELIGKISNLASRSLQMLNRMEKPLASMTAEGRSLLSQFVNAAESIATHFQARDLSKAMVEIRSLAEQANRYFDEKKPWELVSKAPENARAVLTDVINFFRFIAICLKPVLPGYAVAVEKMLGEAPYTWDSLQETLEDRPVELYTHLARRIEKEKIEAIIRESQDKEGVDNMESTPQTFEPLAPMITITDFQKLDLRIARVLEAEAIEGTDKLVRLKVDIGMETRSIIAGIKQAYSPEKLVGRMIVVAANLEPRKMKFGVSEGMLLASGEGGTQIFILSPDSGALPGQRVH